MRRGRPNPAPEGHFPFLAIHPTGRITPTRGTFYAHYEGDRHAPEVAMNAPRDFLVLGLLVSLSTLAAPAAAQTAASIPDFSGTWNHTSLNGLELPLSGPGPLRNLSRLRTGPQAGVSNGAQLV